MQKESFRSAKGVLLESTPKCLKHTAKTNKRKQEYVWNMPRNTPSVACSTAEALAWDKAFQGKNDPSGRAVAGVHEKAY